MCDEEVVNLITLWSEGEVFFLVRDYFLIDVGVLGEEGDVVGNSGPIPGDELEDVRLPRSAK